MEHMLISVKNKNPPKHNMMMMLSYKKLKRMKQVNLNNKKFYQKRKSE
jgi:hypothetical protein